MSTAEQPPPQSFRPSLLLVGVVLAVILGLSLWAFLELRHPDPSPPDVHVLATGLGCADLQINRTEAHAAVSARCTFGGDVPAECFPHGCTATITTFADVVARDRWLADGSGTHDPGSRVVGDLWVVKPSSVLLVPVVVTRLGGHIR
jgi:hypothetical protein